MGRAGIAKAGAPVLCLDIMGSRNNVLWALIAASVIAPASADATVMVPTTLEAMSVEAVLVVTGRVLAQESAWDQAHRKIFTYTEIQVLERIAGDADPKTIVVRTMGGEVGDIGMKVSGVPKFKPEEEVLVFLRNDPVEAGTFQVIGMSQGKFRLVRQPDGKTMAVPSVEGLAFVRRDGTGTYKVDESIGPEGELALDVLKARVLTARSAAPAQTPTLQPTTPTGPITVP